MTYAHRSIFNNQHSINNKLSSIELNVEDCLLNIAQGAWLCDWA